MQSTLTTIADAHYWQTSLYEGSLVLAGGQIALAGWFPAVTGFYGLGSSASVIGSTAVGSAEAVVSYSGGARLGLQGAARRGAIGKTFLTSAQTGGALWAARQVAFRNMDSSLRKDLAAVQDALGSAAAAMQVNLDTARAVDSAQRKEGCK